ncbi:hypothetical protein MPTK1_7g13670 [Marchantia polymorpha subsp. ruderalis]|uniref:Calcineurin-like phosphoesterase domain-containing protein n=2 Tax=Marchantia polymorpha TaxID=3197 RepID=A0A176VMY8_MARPO|nr:hypothetical protein AXG93_412s1290 [Marchantia polymorpha subsp. ruderalis]PTQ46932.1 hypothetical protein MARPO_0009s0052 [Marchantia polymorpha]BBN17328.1 hypothetical protein Mp_7g13670 [Marchantia polymorpha subsp. ruderalis]|eukprot:PTQ46932.1 hypothetical protein MARPO_0009s0052 [Marchantia polymorpha]
MVPSCLCPTGLAVPILSSPLKSQHGVSGESFHNGAKSPVFSPVYRVLPSALRSPHLPHSESIHGVSASVVEKCDYWSSTSTRYNLTSPVQVFRASDDLGSPTSTKRSKGRELLLCSAARLANSDVSSPVNVAGKFNKDMAWADDSLSRPKDPIQYDGCEPPTSIYAPGRRIVAIGDVHGDLERTEAALRLAGVLSSDGQGRWVGGSSVLVQVGDILDRGEDELAILSLLHNLGQQALLKGGAVFQVNGNHETMNVGGDYRFVEAGGYEECSNFSSYCEEEHSGDWEAAFEGWYRTSKERKANRARPKFVSWLLNPLLLQKGAASRALLLNPGGPIAMQLARHGVVLKVNDWLFAHGGILPHHVNYGLERINKEVTQWMRGKPEKQGQLPFIATRGFDSIVWSRLYSRDQYDRPEDKVKAGAVLEAALDAANAKGLIVGHTPQPFGANCEFKGRVWRIDVGMSSGVLHAEPEVLEIVGDKVQVLSASPYGEKAGSLGVADVL